MVFNSRKEFNNSELSIYLCERNIEYVLIDPEMHQANGRIKRLHRTLWQTLKKITNLQTITNVSLKKKRK